MGASLIKSFAFSYLYTIIRPFLFHILLFYEETSYFTDDFGGASRGSYCLGVLYDQEKDKYMRNKYTEEDNQSR